MELVETAFMFSDDGDGGRPIDPSKVSKRWRRAADAAGLQGVRLHDLRHLAASVMLANGIGLHDVSRRLGHAKTSTTLDIYGHAMPGGDKAAAELLGRKLRPALPDPDAAD